MAIPTRQLPLLLSLLGAGCPLTAAATWSIAACDPDGSCGVAVATHDLAGACAQARSGVLHGEGFSVQGNGLAGPAVLDDMRARFLAAQGDLAHRLLAALEAGQAADGPRTGAMSAALLLRTPAGGSADLDLRVEAAAQPVRELRTLLDRRRAQEAILRAERLHRGGDVAAARREALAALALGHDWDRIWRRAARLAMQQGDRGLAMARLEALHRVNPAWAEREGRDPLYAGLLAGAG